jgi:Cell division septal protein
MRKQAGTITKHSKLARQIDRKPGDFAIILLVTGLVIFGVVMAAAKASGNIFWGTGSSEIKDRLMEDPYFADVKVRRKLPHTLVIDVTERKQIAAIVYGSDYIVIDEDGTVLRKTDIDPKVTLITGLTLSKLTVGESVGVEEKETLKLTLKMLGAMDDGDIYFKRINVSNVTIKAYIFDTLIVQGTPKEMIKVIKDGDLAKVVNNLLENDTKRGTISIGDHNYMAFSPDF